MAGAFPINSGPALNQTQQASKTMQGSQTSSSSQRSMPSASQAQPRSQASQATQDSGTEQAQNNTQTAQNTAQSATASGKTAGKSQEGKDFSKVFQSMMQDDSADTPASMTTGMDETLLASTKADGKSASDDSKNKADDTAAAALAGLPLFAADTGKSLPQLSWSGYVGVADNNGATALALQGDQDNVISSQAVAGKDLPNAILKAQEQVANAQLQQGTTPASDGTDFTALLNKQNLPAALHMNHQFLADNVTLPQAQTVTPTAATNTHTAVVNDLSALVATGATRAGDTAQQQVSVPVQNPQWGQQVGDRVQWMIGQNLHQADIHLNPPELGALKVHIQMHGDQASVNFSSPHAQVRDALDAATPRLREMMHEAGLTLGDVNVSGQAFAQHQSRDPNPQQGQHGHLSSPGRAEDPHTIIATSPIQRLGHNSMLDVYA